MKHKAAACVMKLADAYFGNVSGGDTAALTDGLKQELAQAAQKTGLGGLCANIDELTVLTRAAVMIKTAGVYPYYITRLIAAAVHVEQEEDDTLGGEIMLGGVRAAVEELYDYVMEPELSYMVCEAYEALLDGTFSDIDERKQSLVKTGYENGFSNEATYHGCAQCAIKAYYDTAGKRGKEYDLVFRAASSLAGGGACCIDSACGAYSGGNMVIGTLVGRELKTLGQAGSSAGESHALGQRLHDKFMAVYGSVNCRDLHGCKFGRAYNLRDKDDRADFHEAGAHDVICPTTVGLGVAWLIEILFDEGLIG